MAGRSIGRVEITVDANTGRLVAKINKDVKKAATAAQKLATQELSRITGEVNLQTERTREQARVLKTQLEAMFRGIPVRPEFDATEARAELLEFKEEAEMLSLLLNARVKLSEQDLALITADWKGFKAKLEADKIQAKIDADSVDAIIEMQQFREAEEADEIRLRIELQEGLDDALVEAEKVKLLIERLDPQIRVELNALGVPAQVETLVAMVEQIEAEIQLKVDARQALMDAVVEAEKVKLLFERLPIEMKVKVIQSGEIPATVAGIKELVESVEAEMKIQAVADRAATEAAIAEVEQEVARRDVVAELQLRTTKAAAEMVAWRRTHTDPLTFPVEPELQEATIAFEAWLERQRLKGIDVTVDPDTVRATIEFEAWLERMRAHSIDVNVNVDKGMLDGLAGLAESSSDSAGRHLSARWKAIIAGIVALAEPAAVALEGLLAASVSILSSAFNALAGAAGAMIPIFAAMGGVVATLVVGFQGMGGALSSVTKEFAAAVSEGRGFNAQAQDIRDAMRGLAPAAQDVVRAFGELMPIFSQIRSQVQEELFKGLGDELRNLSQTALPAIGDSLEIAARSVNQFLRGLADDLQGVDFAGIMKGLKPALDDIFDAFRSVGRSIEPFLKAATPAAKLLAESFKLAATNLESMISAGAESGKLEDFLVSGVDSLKQWGSLVREVGDALATLFAAGKESGDSMVTQLTTIVEKFDLWMESASGQTALQTFFETGSSLMEQMTPLLEGLKGFFDALVTPDAIARFGELTTALGDVLPFLGELFELVGSTQILVTFADLLAAIGDAIRPILPQLEGLAQSIGSALQAALAQVGDSLPQLATAVGELADQLTPNIYVVIGLIADALTVAVPLLVEALDVFNELPEPVQTLLIAMIAFKPVIGLMGSVGKALQGVGTAIADMRKAATPNLKGLLSNVTAWQIGITAAVGLAVFAWSTFTEKQKLTKKYVDDLTGALSDQLDILLEDADAANASTLGHRALNAALIANGVDGEKLNEALGTLHLTAGDALNVLEAIGRDPISGLSDLAVAFGIPADKAGLLAQAVNDTNENFTDWTDSGMGRKELDALAASLNMDTDQLLQVLAAMEATQDQQEKLTGTTDDVIRSLLEQSAALSPVNQALLEQAEKNKGIQRTGEGLTALYDEYTRLLGINQGVVEDNNTSAGNYAAALDNLAGSTVIVKDDTDDFADVAKTMSERLGDMADEADRSAEKADALKDAWDRLFGSAMSLSEAHDAAIEGLKEFGKIADERKQAITDLADAEADRAKSIADAQGKLDEVMADGEATAEDRAAAQRDLDEAIREGDQAVADARENLAEHTLALRGNSDAALANRQAIRDRVDETLAEAAAMVRNGASYKEAQKFVEDRIKGLGDEAEAAGFNRDVFDTLLQKYKLTPKAVRTSIQLANQEAAKAKLAELQEAMGKLDGKEATVVTKAEGILLVQAGLDGILGTTDDISKKAAKATVKEEGAPQTKAQLQEVIDKAQELDDKIITQKVRTEGIAEVMKGLDGVKGGGDDISKKAATLAVNTTGVPETKEELRGTKALAEQLDGTVATVTVNTVFQQQQGARANAGANIVAQHGGRLRFGGLAGEAGAEFLRYGPLRALVTRPTLVPPGTTVTSAALTAALLRAQQPVGKQVYNTINVTPNQADPEAVATSVLNRAAALANR